RGQHHCDRIPVFGKELGAPAALRKTPRAVTLLHEFGQLWFEATHLQDVHASTVTYRGAVRRSERTRGDFRCARPSRALRSSHQLQRRTLVDPGWPNPASSHVSSDLGTPMTAS